MTGITTLPIGLVALVALTAVSILPYSAAAQTRESGLWWPNTEWGPDDQVGASIRITPEKVMDSKKIG